MERVSKAMSNEILGKYTAFVLQFNDRNISIKTAVDHVKLDGFPYPCLMCFLPSGECITINLITEIIPNRIHQQEDEIATLHAAGKRNTPCLSGCKDEFIIKQMGGGNCILICS